MSEETVPVTDEIAEVVAPEEVNLDETQATDNTGGEERVDFRGSKELNPEQRPLNLYEPGRYTEEELNNMIHQDPTIVMTDEDIEERAKLEPPKEKEEEKPPKVEEDKAEKPASTEEYGDDIQGFYDFTGLSKEEFDSISEVAQEKIFDAYSEKGSNTGDYDKLKDEYYSHKKRTDGLLQDSYIANRAREIETGQVYLPKVVPTLTEDEYNSIDNAETTADRDAIINDVLQKRMEPYIQNAWQARDFEQKNKKQENKTYEIFDEIQKMDSEFKMDMGGVKYKDITNTHPKYTEYQNTIGKVVDYLIQKGDSYATISKKSAKEILAGYNASTGRDQVRDKKIANNARNEILKKLRNPDRATDGKTKARTAKTSGAKGHTRIGSGTLNREDTILQMLDGNMESYNVLEARSDGSPQNVKDLGGILDEYMRRKNLT